MGRPKVRTAEARDDVLRCALDVLERGGPPAVSARRVATAAGTSTAALYEFFGDKAGLVRALYWEGFGALERPAQLARVDVGCEAHLHRAVRQGVREQARPEVRAAGAEVDDALEGARFPYR